MPKKLVAFKLLEAKTSEEADDETENKVKIDSSKEKKASKLSRRSESVAVLTKRRFVEDLADTDRSTHKPRSKTSKPPSRKQRPNALNRTVATAPPRKRHNRRLCAVNVTY